MKTQVLNGSLVVASLVFALAYPASAEDAPTLGILPAGAKLPPPRLEPLSLDQYVSPLTGKIPVPRDRGAESAGPQSQSYNPCRQRDPEIVNNVKGLVEGIRSGQRPEVKTVDDFLGLLPEKMRNDMIFMANSRSLQKATVKDPRVILKSPNSDVVVTFNLDPELPGYDMIEMQVWNNQTAKFELTELQFPADMKDRKFGDKHQIKHGKVTVEDDPQKCKKCHIGGRPIWDPYRFWFGQVPFAEDALDKGSVDVDWYKKYLDDIASGRPRMRQLKPLITKEQIDAELAAKGRVQIPGAFSETTQPRNTPALDLSHQLLNYNGCRIARELASRPDWDKIKYTVAGAVSKSCGSPDKFLDDQGNQNATRYFEFRNIGSKDGKFDFNALVNDTHRRQWTLAFDRDDREQTWLKSQLGTDAKVDEELKLHRKNLLRQDAEFTTPLVRFPTFENTEYEASKSRYLLEPLGIKTNEWSMAFDPETYSHVEFMREIELAPPIQDVIREVQAKSQPPEEFCKNLADLSRAHMGSGPRAGSSANPATARSITGQEDPSKPCSRDQLEGAAVQQLHDTNYDLASRRVGAILSRRCQQCHVDEAAYLGAPEYPMDDVHELGRLICQKAKPKTKGIFSQILGRFFKHPPVTETTQTTQASPTKDSTLGTRLWDRVSRAPDEQGMMPKRGGPLSDSERVAMRVWLKLLPQSSDCGGATPDGSAKDVWNSVDFTALPL